LPSDYGLNTACKKPIIKGWLLTEAARAVTRQIDKIRLEPLPKELEGMKEGKNHG
jgi:hypothetical protein